MVSCHICSSSVEENNYNKHLNVEHNLFLCDKCGLFAFSENVLKEHKKKCGYAVVEPPIENLEQLLNN